MTITYEHNQRLIRLTVLLSALAAFFAWAPSADARIVADGSRAFVDSINQCIATYRNTPGVVGDTIRELENSEHEHKVLDSPKWSNSINDVDDAYDGTGTGTVTRVNAAELEKYKKRFPELVNKDFCTAFLHELYHAVDADRGEWTSDRIDGVKRNEVEATIFQNFLHAIRGVPPRTMYGRREISIAVLGIDPTPTPTAAPTQAPTPRELSTAMSFDHVAPGEYSEIYVAVGGEPGASITVTLPGGEPSPQTVTADGNGRVKVTFKIFTYGTYTATVTSGGATSTASINVN